MVWIATALLFLSLQEAAAPAASAKVWVGREAEFEEYLKTAPVAKIVDVPIGVTKPQRAYLEPGGLAESFAWKTLPPGIHKGFWDGYKAEIAAYELDKMLGLGMVPVVVERRVKSDKGAAVLWLNGVRSWEEALRSPKTSNWTPNVVRMKMFDNLIGNSDRNKGNLLVDKECNIYLIDHSRAFTTDKKLPHAMEHIDKELWQKILALEFEPMKAKLGAWIGNGEIRAMLSRRDRMKKAIDDLVAKNGGEVWKIQ